MDIYFPSCNFTKASPEAAKRLRRWMQARMPVAGCCRTDKTPRAADDTALYFCQVCREVLEGRMQTRSLWEYLDGDADFPLPDYSGLRVNLQDCWRDRAHPEIHEAVRSLLHKMHVEVVELDRNREKADFCGNLHAEPKAPALRAQVAAHGDKPIWEMPAALETAIMREQAEKITERLAVTYCNRCTQGLRTGGAEAVHLLELLMGTAGL